MNKEIMCRIIKVLSSIVIIALVVFSSAIGIYNYKELEEIESALKVLSTRMQALSTAIGELSIEIDEIKEDSALTEHLNIPPKSHFILDPNSDIFQQAKKENTTTRTTAFNSQAMTLTAASCSRERKICAQRLYSNNILKSM
jgi:hypothetical protein